jgi:hypothetical protein
MATTFHPVIENLGPIHHSECETVQGLSGFNTAPADDALFKMKLGLVLNLVGSSIQMFTMNDRALGYVAATALNDITGKYVGQYEAMYFSLKAAGL